MSPALQKEILSFRKRQRLPWHSPPHRDSARTDTYLFTAACFEHATVVGSPFSRMRLFEEILLNTARQNTSELLAWVVLPDHYHFLARTKECRKVLADLGELHGRTSYEWNGEDRKRGRKVWCNATETAMKSERHFWATLNYIHHNPVKHGHVSRWQDWPFSSANSYLEKVGRLEAQRIWTEYPIGDYGKGWDDF